MSNIFLHTKRGVGLIEIVIGVAIFSTIIISVFQYIGRAKIVAGRTGDIIRSNYLLLEAVDVVKIFRDNGWSSNIVAMTTGTKYYLEWDGGNWKAITTVSIIDGKYYRSVQLDNILRDGNDNISSTGVLDPGTRKLTSIVTWLSRTGTTTKIFETYITDLYTN